jgi:hypothetical protein
MDTTLANPPEGIFKKSLRSPDGRLTTRGKEHQAAQQWRAAAGGSQGKAAATPPDVEAPASTGTPTTGVIPACSVAEQRCDVWRPSIEEAARRMTASPLCVCLLKPTYSVNGR